MTLSRDELVKLAAAQKFLLWVILCTISVTILVMGLMINAETADPIAPGIVGIRLFQVVMLIVQVYAVIRLATALNEGWATAIYVVGQCVPCVSLILLLFLNGRATSRLKAAGIRVGLMGANASDVANYLASSRTCPMCGEQIESRETGCPMCGAALAGEKKY